MSGAESAISVWRHKWYLTECEYNHMSCMELSRRIYCMKQRSNIAMETVDTYTIVERTIKWKYWNAMVWRWNKCCFAILTFGENLFQVLLDMIIPKKISYKQCPHVRVCRIVGGLMMLTINDTTKLGTTVTCLLLCEILCYTETRLRSGDDVGPHKATQPAVAVIPGLYRWQYTRHLSLRVD